MLLQQHHNKSDSTTPPGVGNHAWPQTQDPSSAGPLQQRREAFDDLLLKESVSIPHYYRRDGSVTHVVSSRTVSILEDAHTAPSTQVPNSDMEWEPTAATAMNEYDGIIVGKVTGRESISTLQEHISILTGLVEHHERALSMVKQQIAERQVILSKKLRESRAESV